MGVVMAGYSIYLRPDLLQVFWAEMQAGDFITVKLHIAGYRLFYGCQRSNGWGLLALSVR
jgi:hypothetical protein